MSEKDIEIVDCDVCDDRTKFYPKGKCLKIKFDNCKKRKQGVKNDK